MNKIQLVFINMQDLITRTLFQLGLDKILEKQ